MNVVDENIGKSWISRAEHDWNEINFGGARRVKIFFFFFILVTNNDDGVAMMW